MLETKHFETNMTAVPQKTIFLKRHLARFHVGGRAAQAAVANVMSSGPICPVLEIPHLQNSARS